LGGEGESVQYGSKKYREGVRFIARELSRRRVRVPVGRKAAEMARSYGIAAFDKQAWDRAKYKGVKTLMTMGEVKIDATVEKMIGHREVVPCIAVVVGGGNTVPTVSGNVGDGGREIWKEVVLGKNVVCAVGEKRRGIS